MLFRCLSANSIWLTKWNLGHYWGQGTGRKSWANDKLLREALHTFVFLEGRMKKRGGIYV